MYAAVLYRIFFRICTVGVMSVPSNCSSQINKKLNFDAIMLLRLLDTNGFLHFQSVQPHLALHFLKGLGDLKEFIMLFDI